MLGVRRNSAKCTGKQTPRWSWVAYIAFQSLIALPLQINTIWVSCAWSCIQKINKKKEKLKLLLYMFFTVLHSSVSNWKVLYSQLTVWIIRNCSVSNKYQNILRNKALHCLITHPFPFTLVFQFWSALSFSVIFCIGCEQKMKHTFYLLLSKNKSCLINQFFLYFTTSLWFDIAEVCK